MDRLVRGLADFGETVTRGWLPVSVGIHYPHLLRSRCRPRVFWGWVPGEQKRKTKKPSKSKGGITSCPVSRAPPQFGQCVLYSGPDIGADRAPIGVPRLCAFGKKRTGKEQPFPSAKREGRETGWRGTQGAAQAKLKLARYQI